MATHDPISISQTPVNLTDGESAGDTLVGQVTGSQPVVISDQGSAYDPDTEPSPAGHSYQPGEFFEIEVVDGEGNWAYCYYGASVVTLADA